MEIKHIRIRNYESVRSFHVAELLMFSVSSVQNILFIINYKKLYLNNGKNMNTLSEFSAGFLTDLHCRKSLLVPGTMLVNVTGNQQT